MKKMVKEYSLNDRNQLVIKEPNYDRVCMCYQQEKVCSIECAAFQYNKCIENQREYVYLHCISREIELNTTKENIEDTYRDLDILTDTVIR